MLCCSSKSGDNGGRLMEERAIVEALSQYNLLAFPLMPSFRKYCPSV